MSKQTMSKDGAGHNGHAETTERAVPVSASEAAMASSAHARINVPLNLENWRELPIEDDEERARVADLCAWFHNWLLESGVGWQKASAAIGYERSTIFRVLKGTYTGNWSEVARRIENCRKLAIERAAIKHADFAETPLTKLVTGALSYALANNSITTIVGESRMGKTTAARWWRDQNNHGRTIFVTAPTYGGPKALLREIAASLGINKNASLALMHESIIRGFNSNRMLIIDEAHRLLSQDRRRDATQLEIVRDIHDRTGCGLALLATERFDVELRKGTYQYEQVLGRVGMPVRLPREIHWASVKPLVVQYLAVVPDALKSELMKMANDRGRLGVVCETLKFASRIAAKEKTEITAETVQLAIATRRQMMGQTTNWGSR
jgi:DNA transposition AAA+ family ATPase